MATVAPSFRIVHSKIIPQFLVERLEYMEEMGLSVWQSLTAYLSIIMEAMVGLSLFSIAPPMT
jgi:hypothetical protein